MLVSQVIEIMQANYKPTDSIYIEWWDHDLFQDEDNSLTEETWARAVEIAEDADHSYLHGLVWEMLQEAVSQSKEEGPVSPIDDDPDIDDEPPYGSFPEER